MTNEKEKGFILRSLEYIGKKILDNIIASGLTGLVATGTAVIAFVPRVRAFLANYFQAEFVIKLWGLWLIGVTIAALSSLCALQALYWLRRV